MSFRYDLSAVEVPTTVEAEGGDDDTGEFLIEPVDRPRITSLELTSQHPTEQKPTKHDFSGEDADLSFLPKTRLQLTFAANVPIAEAHVANAPATVERIGPDQFQISWEQNKAVAMQIELLSEKAHLLSLPTPVTIGLKVDQPPRVSLSFSGVRQRITADGDDPADDFGASDDYGVAKIDLGSKAEFLDADKKQQSLTHSEALYGATTQPTTEPSENAAASAKPQAATQPGHYRTGSRAADQFQCGRFEDRTGNDSFAERIGDGSMLSGAANWRIACGNVQRRQSAGIGSTGEIFCCASKGERAKFRKQIDECGKIKDALTTLTSPNAAIEIARQHRAVRAARCNPASPRAYPNRCWNCSSIEHPARRKRS